MSSTTTLDQTVAAVVAKAVEVANGRWPVYEAETVPGTESATGSDSSLLPASWVEVDVSRTVGGEYRLAGLPTTVPHYVTVGVASNTRPNVRRINDAMRALEELSIAVGDSRTTPMRFYDQSDLAYLRDLGRFWLITTYSIAI